MFGRTIAIVIRGFCKIIVVIATQRVSMVGRSSDRKTRAGDLRFVSGFWVHVLRSRWPDAVSLAGIRTRSGVRMY